MAKSGIPTGRPLSEKIAEKKKRKADKKEHKSAFGSLIGTVHGIQRIGQIMKKSIDEQIKKLEQYAVIYNKAKFVQPHLTQLKQLSTKMDEFTKKCKALVSEKNKKLNVMQLKELASTTSTEFQSITTLLNSQIQDVEQSLRVELGQKPVQQSVPPMPKEVPAEKQVEEETDA